MVRNLPLPQLYILSDLSFSKPNSISESWTCKFDEFSCKSGGPCIPLSMKCDGKAHCPNGEDEHQCLQQTCTNDAYQCANQDSCIPASWRCDGKPDCAEGDDENLCGN